MNNVEFMSYIPTPDEKHEGVATIRVDRRFIFRFKINANPKGEGYFSNAPSLKIHDNYYPSFSFDSSYEFDEIKKFVLENVKSIIMQHNAPQQYIAQQPFQQPSAPFSQAQQQTDAQMGFNFNPQPTPF